MMFSYTKDQIHDLLSGAGQDVTERGLEDLSICCPFCSKEDPDMKSKCYITPNHPTYGSLYHCFRCGKAGGMRGLFKELGIQYQGHKLSMGQLKEKVAKARTYQKFRSQEKPNNLTRIKLPEEYIMLLPDRKAFASDRAYRWLENRGLNWADIVDWKIGYCLQGRFAQHLILPVFDEQGEIETFQARRFIGTGEPKTKNPYTLKDEIGKSDVLYGAQKVRKGQTLFLVEGPFDVHYLNKTLRKIGARHCRALGLLGHQISRIQIQRINAMEPGMVFVMMDADAVADGHKIARRLAPWVSGNVYITELEYGDPDDLSPNQLVRKVKKSLHVPPKIALEKTGPGEHVYLK